ncbi:heme peroxidase [Viridothelium virens]|uniref:Heme peroxidase n=1 Tax=Viridothelium virens TaxID=1048519 RepID=A0A6A6HF09_VIRVR|nr:heme peroxidase [Viridothelium virens]
MSYGQEALPNGNITPSHTRGEGHLDDFMTLLHARQSAMPTQTGDGTYVPEDPRDHPFSGIEKFLDTVSNLPSTEDLETLKNLIHLRITGEPWDDRKYVMEGLIQLAAKRPSGDPLGTKLTNGFITQLWNDLQHPPQSYLGKEFQYRRADGSGNSILYPHIGAANTPYARSVQPRTVQPAALPDPGVLFDSLLARQKHEPHPSGISSMLFYLATIIIHDLFRTDHQNFANSKTSSYLDLSPLYGSVWEEQEKVRAFQDGKLKPDCFSEVRILSFPPGVGALLIMFNRFHNYVVEQLALIDENGRFSRSKQRDEDLFQTGRLITCGLYVSIILGDYLRTIMNLNRTNAKWMIDPRTDIDNLPKGHGNQVSAEFNLVYRWHSAVSKRDVEFTEEYFQKLFPGKAVEQIEERELLQRLSILENKLLAQDPEERDFHGLERTDGKFSDDDLVKIIKERIEDCGNEFGARTVPSVFKAVEALGIKQARAWNLSTLNEFRKHFNLTTYKTFEEINPDPYVADQLKHLYDHPDNVEIYPGLAVEGKKKVTVPGSGLVPPFTIARALFSDATAVIRGDRFYSIEHTPKQLTNWGYAEQDADMEIDNGCCFYKLFQRAFPNHFRQDSMWAHYPLTIPEEMRKILVDLETIDNYTTDGPKRMPPRKVISSYEAAKNVLGDENTFKVTWGEAIECLGGPAAKEFALVGDGPTNPQSQDLMQRVLYPEGWEAEVKTYFEKITAKLLHDKSHPIANLPQADIIRDIGNLAPLHFISELFCIPIKTPEHPHVPFTEAELYEIMAACYISFFFDPDPEHSFDLRQRARPGLRLLAHEIQTNIVSLRDTGLVSRLLHALPWMHKEHRTLTSYGPECINRLLESGRDVRHLVWTNVIWSAAGIVVHYGALFAQAVEYFLGPGKEHMGRLSELARQDGEDADKELLGYFLEATRLANESGVVREVAQDTTIMDVGKEVKFEIGDRVLVNVKAASRDGTAFENPDTFDPHRDPDSYIHLGFGPGREGLGAPMAKVALTAMFKTVMKLDNLQPMPGPQGQIKKVLRKFGREDGEFRYHLSVGTNSSLGEKVAKVVEGKGNEVVKEEEERKEGYHVYMTNTWDMYFPFPTSECSSKFRCRPKVVILSGLESMLTSFSNESKVDRGYSVLSL